MVLLRTVCQCGEPLLIVRRDIAGPGDAAIVVYSAHQVGAAITRCPSCGTHRLIRQEVRDRLERAGRVVSAPAAEDLAAGSGIDA